MYMYYALLCICFQSCFCYCMSCDLISDNKFTCLFLFNKSVPVTQLHTSLQTSQSSTGLTAVFRPAHTAWNWLMAPGAMGSPRTEGTHSYVWLTAEDSISKQCWETRYTSQYIHRISSQWKQPPPTEQRWSSERGRTFCYIETVLNSPYTCTTNCTICTQKTMNVLTNVRNVMTCRLGVRY